MYDKTITLFNYHKQTDSWRTTVFTGVDLVETVGANATRQGHTNSDAVELLINMNKDTPIVTPTDTAGVTVSKQYLPPKAYAALSDPVNHFTFTPEHDFFREGNHYSAEPISDADYEDGLYSDINTGFDGVYMVSSAAYFSLIPHFEIGGR